jgi:pseudoazurin
MSITRNLFFIMVLLSTLFSTATMAAESHTINAEARRFVADILYIQAGDSVGWINMTSHNTVSIEGLIPEGAEPWRSELGQNLQLALEVEGVYAYVCEPHLGFGMVGLIVVGEPTNLEAVRAASLKLEGPYRRILGKLKKLPATE